MSRRKMWNEIYRKVVHISLSLLVLLPFIVKLPLDIYSYYGGGLFLAALINSFVVKRIQVKEDIKLLRETLDRIFSIFEKEIGEPVKLLEEGIDRLERLFFHASNTLKEIMRGRKAM